MTELGFLDRLREFVRSRRFMWIITITFAVALFLYMLFVTLIFNPFEAKLEDTATIVPAQVDYFVRWDKAGEQFGEFPQPKAWSFVEDSPSYKEAKSAGAMDALGAKIGVTNMLAEIGNISQYLPIGLSLKDDFLGEVVVTGKGEMHFDSRFEGMVMLRGSSKVKMGVAMLGFGFIREKLPESIQIEELDDDIYKIPQFESFGFQDAYLGRVQDIIILTSRLEMIGEARDLNIRSGQDSLAQASNFRDNVTAYLGPDEHPLEVFFRWDKIGSQVGRWPDPNSESVGSRFVGRLFHTGLLRYLSGYLELDEHMVLRLSGDVDLSTADSFTSSWLEGSGVSAQRMKDFAAMTPASSFSFSAIGGDPGKVLTEAYDLAAGDLRRTMDEAVAQSGQYQGMAHLLREIGSVYKPGIAVVMSEYVAPKPPEDGGPSTAPAHDNTPVPFFAVMGKVRDMVAYQRIFDFLKQNWTEFTGRREDPIQTVRFNSGATATSFVSRVVPGTGELVLLYVPTLETLILTNSADFAQSINSAAFEERRSDAAKRKQLLHQEGFAKALAASSNGAHLFLWMDPGKARMWLEKSSLAAAEETYRAEKEAVWRSLRPQEEKRLRGKMFDGRTDLNAVEEAELLGAIDDALLRSDSGSASRIPELTEENRKAWLSTQVMDWFSFGLRVSRRHAEVVIHAKLGG
ncbi:MAG: hypothetical protein O3A95_03565 [Planctomycetota bacterium]|nr:hypothetical protein [Planctomycetota bacterium]MDA1113359.1 hypothetical protein [Planctomycetota bacterium]